ncbi:hypothetical protein ZIOFF_018298 [Zingiber officinale]|uniref:Pentatricopeptide repeat-containing protein n=1 Tax=Zingiber officinale TaxID=94328 RepID=A0A8J5LAU7_ZINOF|nr:hypothetical protein ZIOFF_018298 [Zingiber officinale]
MRHQGDANLNHYTLPLLNCDVYLCNTMMEVYARNGRVPLARRLFEEMPLRDVVTWTSLLSSYVSAGDSPEAFHLFC